MRYQGLNEHQMFDRCVRILRNALLDWNANGAIQNAAATLGMDRFAYCLARLNANQFQWFDVTTSAPFTEAHLQAAWLEARRQIRG